ncbi:L-fuculose-phosphate aldolase [Brevibacillus humidisoli]|uniref:L-fuculose-phosphate aldolase n=1 Tax=Brevibacillus humidisoli TaxID=2895522 RepID=UPI001E32D820|nr:L-fuculose-phosphate aldolase [Brevibacillus humidisoli]UFJ39864.1 L-fuculose-phosphate aldolase [Brevibacillus humidisoli]
MLLQHEREQIVEYGKKLVTHGLTKGRGGNLSIYNPEQQLMAISPSGVDYFETKPEDVVVLDLQGNVVDGEREPSSEYPMHSIFYRHRSDIKAVVHTHSVYATTIACLNWTLPAVHYLVAFAGPDVRCAPYATYGTEELAEHVLEGMRDRKAVLLANHGLIAGADTLARAFYIAEEVEFCAEVYYRSKSVGEPVILPRGEIELVMEKMKGYGVNKE